jgi:hypothetical protein
MEIEGKINARARSMRPYGFSSASAERKAAPDLNGTGAALA